MFTTTVTQTVTATRLPPFAARKNKIKKNRKCLCKHHQSSVTRYQPQAHPFLPGHLPSRTTPVSDCPSQQEDCSACLCINVASTTSTITAPASTITSAVGETNTVTVLSVFQSVATKALQTTIYQQFQMTAKVCLDPDCYNNCIYRDSHRTTNADRRRYHPEPPHHSTGNPSVIFLAAYLPYSNSPPGQGAESAKIVISTDGLIEAYSKGLATYKQYVTSDVDNLLGRLKIPNFPWAGGFPVFCVMHTNPYGRLSCHTQSELDTLYISSSAVYLVSLTWVPFPSLFKMGVVVNSQLATMT